jgi:predicted metalloprotease with PDZ domain
MGEMHEGDQERADYWFSEGFTDFYAWRLLLASGELDPKAFARVWNEMLLAYASSPARDAPGAKIVEGFWKDRSVEKLPYQRGAILAAKWDRELREKSGGRVGLDDVVRAMVARAKALGPASPKAPDLFVEVARTFGLDAKADVDAVIVGGAPALLPPDAFGACLPVKTATIPAFDYGFDIDATRKTNTVTGLKAGSPAYAAGLRDGMTYMHRESGEPGDSRQPMALRVKDKGEERVITYSPVGAATITLQEVVPPQGLSPSQTSACVAGATGGEPTRAAAASR